MGEQEFRTRIEELRSLIQQVPHGRVVSYGQLGRALKNPVSGYLAGKWMAGLVDHGNVETPWWRVIRNDGSIALFKRDISLGIDQVARLNAEGVPFALENQVDIEAVRWEFDA